MGLLGALHDGGTFVGLLAGGVVVGLELLRLIKRG